MNFIAQAYTLLFSFNNQLAPNEAMHSRKLVDRYKIDSAWCGVHVFANSYKKNYKHPFDYINIDK